jgi:hypothetical protein
VLKNLSIFNIFRGRVKRVNITSCRPPAPLLPKL